MDRYVLVLCTDIISEDSTLLPAVLQKLTEDASRYKEITITTYFGEASQQVYTAFVHPLSGQDGRPIADHKQQRTKSNYENIKWEAFTNTDTFCETLQGILHRKQTNCPVAQSENTDLMAEQLHLMADALPYTGFLLDIIWFGNVDFSIESNLGLYGALQRLVTCHNGFVTLLYENTLSAEGWAWVEALQGTSCSIGGSTRLLVDTLWRGSVTFHNIKTGDTLSVPNLSLSPSTGSVLTGQYSIVQSDQKVSDLTRQHYGTVSRRKKRQPPVLAMSPHLVFLDEVYIGDIPTYVLSNSKLKLSLMSKISDANSSSQAFLERINKRKEFGTIVRLTFGHSTDPPIDDLRVDTQTWMNRVINNVTAEDSIVKLSGSTDYHNFLLLSAEDGSSCSHSADDTLNMDYCFAYLMKKPADINGAIVDDLIKIDRQMNRKQNEDNKAKEKISDTLGTEINFANALRKSGIIQDVRKVAGKSSQTGRGITHNVKTPDNESESKTGSYWLISPEIEQHVKELLSSQPKYSPDSLVKIETKIADAQASVLKQWIEFRQAEGQSTKMAYSELLKLLSEVRKQCLSIVSQQGVFPRTIIKDVKLLPKDSFSELAVEPDQWLEKEALLHVEDTVKKIQRYKSTDSLGGLMPPAKDDSVTLDVSEFLKYFKADGSSVADNLKPVHFGRSKQSHQVDGSLDPDTVSTMRWPEVKRRCFHDMYYNNDDTTAERKEQKANRIRSRYVGNETGSTCNVHQRSQPVTIAQLTNAAKREKERDLKEQEKLSNDVTKRGKRKQIGEAAPSMDKNGLQAVRQSIRKSKDGGALEDPVQMSARKRKILVPVKAADRKKAACQPKDTRRGDSGREDLAAQSKMSAKAQSSSQPVSRESRSERHRRKLEEIVTATLVANGITADHSLYASCKTRLYKLTKMYVMDLTTSRNLKEEMKKIAEDHVKQVISFETKRIDPSAS